MFCRECGHKVGNTEFCLNCGFRHTNGYKYCNSCGSETKINQEMCINCKSMLMTTSNIRYAGFWIRFVALLIDSLIIGIPIMIFALIFGIFSAFFAYSSYENYDTSYDSIGAPLEGIFYLVCTLIGIIYYAGMQSSKWQGTIGKKLVGIKVTDLSGQRISFWRAIGRYLANFLSCIFYIGYIMAGFTKRKQALHDMISGTLVVKK